MVQKNSFKVLLLYFILIKTSFFQSCDVAFDFEDPYIEKNKFLKVNSDITKVNQKDTITVLSFEQFGQAFVENMPEQQQRNALSGYSFNELFNLSSDKSSRISFSNKTINAGVFKGRTETIQHGDRGYTEIQIKFSKRENGDIDLEYNHISKSDHSNFPYFKVRLLGTLNTIIVNPYNKNQDNSDFHIFGMVLTQRPYCAVGQQLADIRGFITNKTVSNNDRTVTGACGNNMPMEEGKLSEYITEDPTAKLRSDFFTSFRKGTLLFFTFRISKDEESQKLTLEYWLPPVSDQLSSTAFYHGFKNNFLAPYGTSSPPSSGGKKYNYSEYEFLRVHATRTGFSRLSSDFTNYFKTINPAQVSNIKAWRVNSTGQVFVLKMDDIIDFS